MTCVNATRFENKWPQYLHHNITSKLGNNIDKNQTWIDGFIFDQIDVFSTQQCYTINGERYITNDLVNNDTH